MKRTFLTAFALLSFMNFAAQADDNPVVDTTAVRHLNLNEVQINASRVNAKMKDLPQKIEVITARCIASTPANDVAELLKKNSGIDIIQYPGVKAAIGMRGFSPSTSNKYNVILVNGKPVGTENIATLNLANVEKIEIMKGPFSALYGSDAMAGVINIITKQGSEEFGGAASISYGSFQTTKLDANVGGKLADKLFFDAAFSRHQQNSDYKIGDNNFLKMSDNDKAIVGEDTYGEKMENTRFKKTNANFGLAYHINANWSVKLNTEYFKAKDVETPGSFWHVYGMKKKDIERKGLNLDITGVINNHKLTFSPYYSNEDNDYYDLNSEKDFYNSSRSTLKVYGFQLQDHISFGNHSLVVGLDSKTNKYESLRWAADGENKSVYQPDNFDRNLGLLAQGHFRFFDGKMNVAIGARYDNIKFQIETNEMLKSNKTDENYSIVNPNIGVNYELVKNFKAHASYGTAFFAPNAYQVAGSYSGYYTYEGNADLDPEKSRTFDFGLAYDNFVKGIKFDMTYFDTRHKDMILGVWKDKANNLKTYENADEAKMRGLEIAASYDFGAINDYNYSLRLYANYTHMLKTDIEKDEEVLDLQYVREKSGSFGLEFDNLEGFYTRLNARYSGHRYARDWYGYYNVRPDVTDDVLKHPDFLIFDISASYTFNEKYTLGASIANILDENYTEKDGYNMQGRAVMAKFGYKF